jgi:hypothetical protein
MIYLILMPKLINYASKFEICLTFFINQFVKMMFVKILHVYPRNILFVLSIYLITSYNINGQSDSPFLIVDQFGYLPNAPKIAVIKDPQIGFDAENSFTPGSLYAVVNNATGDTVFTGTPVSWRDGGTNTSSGDRAWHFDFTEVSATGTYFIVDVEKNIRSYRFNISPSVYNEVLRQTMRTFFTSGWVLPRRSHMQSQHGPTGQAISVRARTRKPACSMPPAILIPKGMLAEAGMMPVISTSIQDGMPVTLY